MFDPLLLSLSPFQASFCGDPTSWSNEAKLFLLGELDIWVVVIFLLKLLTPVEIQNSDYLLCSGIV